jgi:hypothetical protein
VIAGVKAWLSGGGDNQGSGTNNTNPTVEGGPTDTANGQRQYPGFTSEVRRLLFAKDAIVRRLEGGDAPAEAEVLGLLGQFKLAQRANDAAIAGRAPGSWTEPGSGANSFVANQVLQFAFYDVRAAWAGTGNPTATDLTYSDLASMAISAAAGMVGNIRTSRSAADGVRLGKQLASEAQTGELMAGGGQSMAGAGAKKPINDNNRIVQQHGGSAEDWAKVRSSSYTAADGVRFETHAYQNTVTGAIVELKTKFQ